MAVLLKGYARSRRRTHTHAPFDRLVTSCLNVLCECVTKAFKRAGKIDIRTILESGRIETIHTICLTYYACNNDEPS